ncbi:MAG: hypothetical protein G5Z42_00005 [Caldisphaeraceae archaeon]|nr:hypothetical protein [Caldisphaeraceae archaeon]MEB3797187.1 hypothetical protein [Caldisphaeraceae archaeon]
MSLGSSNDNYPDDFIKQVEGLIKDNYGAYTFYTALLITRFSFDEKYERCIKIGKTLIKKFWYWLRGYGLVGSDWVIDSDGLNEWINYRINSLLRNIEGSPIKKLSDETKQVLREKLQNSFDILVAVVFKKGEKIELFPNERSCKEKLEEILRFLDYIEERYYPRFKQAYMDFVRESLLDYFEKNVQEAEKAFDILASFLEEGSRYNKPTVTRLGSICFNAYFIRNYRIQQEVSYDMYELLNALRSVGAIFDYCFDYYIFPKPILDGSLRSSLKEAS